MKLQRSRLDVVYFPESSRRRRPASIFVAVTLPCLDTGFRRYDRMFVPNRAGCPCTSIFEEDANDTTVLQTAQSTALYTQFFESFACFAVNPSSYFG